MALILLENIDDHISELKRISLREDNWDTLDGQKPLPESIRRAYAFLLELRESYLKSSPLIEDKKVVFLSSDEDGYITLDIYHATRDLYFVVYEDYIECLKVKGTNIQDDMEYVKPDGNYDDLWLFLYDQE